MFVRMFQPRFARLVETGEKCQTIRPTPRRVPPPGAELSLREWTGRPYRSKQRVLRNTIVLRTAAISIVPEGWVWLDRYGMKNVEAEDFARADGFGGLEEMIDWFGTQHGLPFRGIVIYWPKLEVRA